MSYFPSLPEIQFKTYMKEKLFVLVQCDVTVKFGDQVKNLIITVVDGDGPSLLGRDWMKQLRCRLDSNFYGKEFFIAGKPDAGLC